MNNSTKKKSLGSPPKQPVPLFFLYKSDKWEEVQSFFYHVDHQQG